MHTRYAIHTKGRRNTAPVQQPLAWIEEELTNETVVREQGGAGHWSWTRNGSRRGACLRRGGAAVALADRDEALVRKAAKDLTEEGHKAIAIRSDVTDERQVREMVNRTVADFGRLDAAFNNAGVQSPAVETADAGSEEFDRVTAINLKSVWMCMKYELQQPFAMVQRLS